MPEGELNDDGGGDLRAFVVFTQLRDGQPYRYAGWLDAADDMMAIFFAREHYGRDQKVESLWAIPRDALDGEDLADIPRSEPFDRAAEGSQRDFQIMTQKAAGDAYVSAGTVAARSFQEALSLARTDHPAESCKCIWVADAERIIKPAEHDLMWRHTDQLYRLARGYSRGVRQKWTQFREDEALTKYEAQDIKEAF